RAYVGAASDRMAGSRYFASEAVPEFRYDGRRAAYAPNVGADLSAGRQTMTTPMPARAHVIAGGFPRGKDARHHHDFARLRLLEFLHEQEIPASVAGDFSDVEKWLQVSRLLITYVAGPYPDADQSLAIRNWLEGGGRWLGLHGTAGGRAV